MNRESQSVLVRFLAVWIIIAGTAVFLNARGSFESVPPHQQLENFPHELAGWTGQDLSIDSDVLQVLGSGDFLSRVYKSASTSELIDLFIAYYPSQRTGDTIHSPQNCLPGSGWTPLRRDYIRIVSDGVSGKNTAIANRFVFARGTEQVYVLYWYQAHGRTTPSEYWAKFYLVRDSIVMHRSDGAIVRIVTPIADPSDEAKVDTYTTKFAQLVISKLDDYIPR